MNTQIEHIIGQYKLVHLIGHGSMADVYLATQVHTHQYVAIKLIHPHLLGHQGVLRRFAREARVLAELEHPHIVRVHHYVCEPHIAYMAMEYLEGGTLEQRLGELSDIGEHLPLDTVFQWMDVICNAVDFAHSKGLIHRDLKPANILFRKSGEPVLTDFGLAFLMDLPRISQTNSITGTPAYLSPEQARGEVGDTRSDIYSLGVILYEILAGETPFQGSGISVVMKHLNEAPPSPRTFGRFLPQEVEAVVMKALEKDPYLRFHSAHDLALALRRTREPVEIIPEEPPKSKAPVEEGSEKHIQTPLKKAASFRPPISYAGTLTYGLSSSTKAPPWQTRLRTTLVVLILIAFIAGLGVFASSYANRQSPISGPPAAFREGTLVRVIVPDGQSISVLATCPAGFWEGVLGVATDGQTAQVLDRQLCNDIWWFEIAIADLSSTDWHGIGWINGEFLQPR